jgi:TrmH family RNA methyltransferase
LGARGVIALSGTAELANPKVLRSAMGASFRLPSVVASAADFLAWSRAHDVSLWVTAADGEPVHDAPRAGPIALVLGNEGAGVSAELRDAASRVVAIPLAAGAESLNVAAAAAILLYEVKRD